MWLFKPNTLSETQCRELEEVITTTRNIKVYRRAKVILYRNAGYTADEIQEHIEYSERTQQYWLSRYQAEGAVGLRDHPRSGRPRSESQRFSGEQTVKQEAEQEVEQDTEKTVSKLDYWARVTLECMQVYHPKRYVRKRAQMLLLRDNRYSATEIADILGVNRSALYRDPGFKAEVQAIRESKKDGACNGRRNGHRNSRSGNPEVEDSGDLLNEFIEKEEDMLKLIIITH